MISKKKFIFFAAKSEVKASLSALANITALKKLCNHPDLVYDKIMERADGFENAAKLMPSNYSTKLVNFLYLPIVYSQIF